MGLLAINCNGTSKVKKLDSAANQLPKVVQIASPSGQLIKTHMAITDEEQKQGLSGMKPADFSAHEGMLFFYTTDEVRMFWMPDTYFDLDLFFLNKNLKIVDVHRSLKFHPGRQEPPAIARSKHAYSRHILEMRSDSSLAKSLKRGDYLKWMGKSSLLEIESKIRRAQ
jgi:uncharacterized membrane protein (UPF0127 family)